MVVVVYSSLACALRFSRAVGLAKAVVAYGTVVAHQIPDPDAFLTGAGTRITESVNSRNADTGEVMAVVHSNLARAIRFDRAVGFIRVGVAYGTLLSGVGALEGARSERSDWCRQK